MHYIRGGTVLPSTTLFTGIALLLAFVLIVMAGIFFVEGNPAVGFALIVTVAALGYGLRRIHRKTWS